MSFRIVIAEQQTNIFLFLRTLFFETALPPVVRNGYAFPLRFVLSLGYALAAHGYLRLLVEIIP
jgi:hypothetical protein